ncbi:hypothetical protein [Vampirovibrio sp.]|uniref:hypothetical protein n=1 Tax=Vampirovibrio sp. TaxID=2717857 RepID=UPI00359418C0
MLLHPFANKTLALSLGLGLCIQGMAPVWAVDDFATQWQARPLVDNTVQPQAPAQASPAKAAQPAATPQADLAALEAQLKPAEPFIASVEKNLLINPKQGAFLTDRLTELQTVLYGEQKYQDAGELLAEMAKVFPAEATKAHADLTAKMQSNLPPSSGKNPPQAISSASASKQRVNAQPMAANTQPAAFGSPSSNQASNQQAAPPKKRFWEREEDPFANDPFFQDQQPTPSYQAQQTGPSKLGAIGQGLAGLAMMAGSVAGSYYLNKNTGNAGLLPNNGYQNGYPNGYYNNQPYANPYGSPYGYGVPAYGVVPGQLPYGYNQPYLNRPVYGTTLTTQPYSRFGNSTVGISPLGVPTGFRPY